MGAPWRSALAQAMIEDLQVAILPSKAKEATEMFREMRDYVPPAAEARIVATNGNQRIEFPTGGRVLFLGGHFRVRGMALDKLYVSFPVYHDHRLELEPAIATSRIGEVITF